MLASGALTRFFSFVLELRLLGIGFRDLIKFLALSQLASESGGSAAESGG